MDEYKVVKLQARNNKQYWVTIPKEIINKLNLQKGDKLLVYISDGKIVMRKL